MAFDNNYFALLVQSVNDFQKDIEMINSKRNSTSTAMH